MPTRTPKIKFLLDQKKLVQTQFGACCFHDNIPNLPGLIPFFKEASLTSLYYLDLDATMLDSDAKVLTDFKAQTGCSLGAYHPIYRDDLWRQFPFYVEWLRKLNVEFIQADVESAPKIAPDLYIARAQKLIDNFGNVFLDAGQIARPTPDNTARNVALKSVTDVNFARQYEHLQDLGFHAGDQNSNYLLIQNYFQTLLPQYLTDFHKQLQPDWKQVILQWQNEDAGQNNLSEALRNYAIGKMVEYTLQNTEWYPYLYWMAISTMSSRTGLTPQGIALKRVAPLAKFKYTVPIQNPYTDCTMQGFWDGADSFSLLVNTAKTVEPIILPGDFKIHGKIVTGNLTNDYGTADDWKGSVTNTSASNGSALLHKYGVNVITFKTTAQS